MLRPRRQIRNESDYICVEGLFRSYRCGYAVDLLEVVDVVAGHGLDDGPEGHGTAFGVGGRTMAVDFIKGG